MGQVNDSQGVQAGTGNVQINVFTGGKPRDPVVVGNVPQAPPAFQPREELMAQLRTAGPGVSVVRAVTGMRGVGKTQLAAAYARECIDAGWSLVAWINAEDTPGVLTGLALVAARLGIDNVGTDLEAIAARVRNHLEADGDRCLITFDNVTDTDELKPYMPAAGKPQVVITSADTTTTQFGKPMPVDVFTERESRDFLAERTGHSDCERAEALAEELGHLPLALAQAAAVIAVQHLTYPAYMDRLRSYPAEKYLPPVRGDPYPRGAAEAILLSIDAAMAADPTGLCGDILDLVSLLSPTGVSRELLYLSQSGAAHRPAGERWRTRWRRRQRRSLPAALPPMVDDALGRLANASLLAFSADGASVTAHRLVMRVTRDRCARDGTLTAVGARACDLLASRRESLGEAWQDRPAARDFVQQATAVHEHLTHRLRVKDDMPDKEILLVKELLKELLKERGWALWYLNKLADSPAQAVDLGEPLAADLARVLGDWHPDTLTGRNNLADAYRAAGRLGDAIPLFERTLADRERVLGELHRYTLLSRNNLAYSYRLAGRAREGIPLLERTVADDATVLGESDPDTLLARNNLAGAYHAADRAGDAVPLYERTLAERARVLGESHPDTLLTGSNLASAYEAVGRLADAIARFEESLAGFERVLGAEHPDTVVVRGNLARARRAAEGQGDGSFG
jgi:tetratricopeptide (TPR) repeat protein